MPSRRELWAFVGLAAVVRALVTWNTLMPGRDGATYLWMAERVAAGDVGAAFRTVFHPLYPLLTGGWLTVFPWFSPVVAGQSVGLVMGALAALPLVALAWRLFGAAAGRVTGLLYAFGLWFARYPAECHSEGCFYFAVAVFAWALLCARPRPCLAGIAVAAAYATRPEGLALVVLGWLRLRLVERAGSRRFLGLALVIGGLVPLGYAVWGEGATLTPKAAFNYEVGAGSAVSPARHYLHHALRVPGTAFEAIGYLTFPLAVAGLWIEWRRRVGVSGLPRSGVLSSGVLSSGMRVPALWLAAPIAIQIVVVPLLRSHARFLSGFGVLLLPLAAAALVALVQRSRRWRALACAVVLLPDIVRLPAVRGDDRIVERDLGQWLRSRLRPGDFIATEMPRLEYFAGVQPGPPRAISREELLRASASPSVRYVVVVAVRSSISAGDLEQLGLRPVSLPQSISVLARERGLLVYERA